MQIQHSEGIFIVLVPRLILPAEMQDSRVLHDPVQVMSAGAADKVLGIIPHIVVPDHIVYGLRLPAVEHVEHILVRQDQFLFVLADAPETGVFACVKRSKELMQNRKGAYFTLMLSFIGWALLLSITQVLLMSLVGYVIASTVYMVLNLALQVYMNATSCEFYLQVKGEEPIIVLDAPNQEN